MREIKFRAWDKNKKVMVPVERIDWLNGFNGKPGIFLNNISYSGWIFHHDDYELMQYTGLHDKNGKEIYEGDIVSRFETDKGNEIIFRTGEDETPSFGFKDSTSYIFCQSLCWMYEIIGNIYENPGLLK